MATLGYLPNPCPLDSSVRKRLAERKAPRQSFQIGEALP